MKLRTIGIAFLGVLLFSNCDPLLDNEPALSVSPSSISMYADETYQLIVNKTNVSYTVGDSWYATVNTSGLVTASRKGNTTIRVSDGVSSYNVNVEVKSKYELYPELDDYLYNPISSLSTVFGNYDDIVNLGDEEIIGNIYWYRDRGKYGISFGFIVDAKNANKEIEAILVTIPVQYENQMETYLWNRYYCSETVNDVYLLYNHDKTVYLRLEYIASQLAYCVFYATADDMKDILSLF